MLCQRGTTGVRIITCSAVFEFLYREYLGNKTFVNILLADLMSPAYSGCRVASAEDLREFRSIVPSLLQLAPLVSATTMAPDIADQGESLGKFNAETTRIQWLSLLQSCSPGFSEEKIVAEERTGMYADFTNLQGPFDFVLHTGETAGYGNLALKLDVANSPIFKDFRRMPPELVMALRRNHSSRIVIVPDRSEVLVSQQIPPRLPWIVIKDEVANVANCVSAFWLPDGHVDRPGVDQVPVRIHLPNLRSAESGHGEPLLEFKKQLNQTWWNAPAGFISAEAFMEQVCDWRSALVVRCLQSPSNAPHVVMINGPTVGVS